MKLIRPNIAIGVTFCVGAAIWCGSCGKSNTSAPSGGAAANTPADPKAQADKDDQEAQRLIADKSAEARQWLDPAQANHTGFKMSKATMLDWTSKFYTAGAIKVYAVDMAPVNNVEVCAMLVIEMPSDHAARQAILKVNDDLNEEDHPTPDNGGKYIIESLD
jgi:hypothetical protein